MMKMAIPRLLILIACLALSTPGWAAQPLRIGTNVWPGYEPLYLAAEREDWQERLRVRLVEYPSATEVLRAFRNRALEAAALTMDEVLTLREADIPLKIVAVLDVSAGGDVILAKPHIKQFADLAGQRVGVESSALGAFVLTRALEINNMQLDQVEIVHLDVSTHERAFKNNTVDAVVTFEPVRTLLLNTGAHEIFSSLEIPGEVVDVLVVHADILRTERDRLRQVVAGWFDALNHMRREPLAAAKFTARRLQITPEQARASFDGLDFPDAAANRRLLDTELPHTLQRLQETLIGKGLLRRPRPTGPLLDARLLPQT